MAHTDPVADLLTRIRNATRAGHDEVRIGFSNLKEQVARVMLAEGYINSVNVDGVNAKKEIVIKLKYTADKKSVLTNARRVSRPSRRVYVSYEGIASVRNGLGVAVLSTPKGVLTDTAARKSKVGGEVLCEIW